MRNTTAAIVRGSASGVSWHKPGRSWAVARVVPLGLLAASVIAAAPPAHAAFTPSVGGTSSPAAASGVRRDGHHSATALTDARVLVSGGGEPAQLFDPAEGTWTPTGPMVVKRSAHTATMLDGPACKPASNGTGRSALPSWCHRVLVVGGVGDAGSLASAELFDPKTATWAATGSLALKRFGHTATLLGDGTVLVAGGAEAGHGPFRAEAEVYDPAKGTWAAAGTMEIGRAYHSATLLDDGTVLVAGGQGAAHDKSLADAVVYTPATRTWAAVPHLMSARRALHTAALLPGGKVLVAGGTSQREGQGPADVLSSAEIYDPTTTSFFPAPPMAERRVSHTATVLSDGRVYVLGGAGTADESGVDEAASAEVFDPEASRWLNAAPVTAAPRLHTATLLGPRGCRANCGAILVVSPDSAQLATPPTPAAPHTSPGAGAGHGKSASPVVPLALVIAAGVAAGAVAIRRRSAAAA